MNLDDGAAYPHELSIPEQMGYRTFSPQGYVSLWWVRLLRDLEYHTRVRSDMNELITELDGYKLRLLEENRSLKAKFFFVFKKKLPKLRVIPNHLIK